MEKHLLGIIIFIISFFHYIFLSSNFWETKKVPLSQIRSPQKVQKIILKREKREITKQITPPKKITPKEDAIIPKEIIEVFEPKNTKIDSVEVVIIPTKKIVEAPPINEKEPEKINFEELQKIRQKYAFLINSLIKENLIYPKKARRFKREGITKISFIIHQNGKISNINIAESSNHKELDLSALEAVKKIKQLPQMNNDLIPAQWKFEIPVTFELIKNN